MRLKEVWLTDTHAQNNILSNDPELGTALAEGDDNKIERLVGKRINEQMEAKKAEQAKRIKLLNADPNDIEA
jgi:hypothetical protein